MKYFLYPLLVLFFFSGCTKKNNSLKIESNVSVQLVNSTDGNIEIRAITDKVYNCMNYPIIYSKKQMGKTIIIKFKKVDEQPFCLTALGPATANIDLGSLNEKSYKLKFKLNEEVTEGILTTTPLNLEIITNGNVYQK